MKQHDQNDFKGSSDGSVFPNALTDFHTGFQALLRSERYRVAAYISASSLLHILYYQYWYFVKYWLSTKP